MKNRNFKKVCAIIITAILVCSSIPATAFADFDFTAPSGMYLLSNTKKNIAPGISENAIITNDSTGDNQVMGYAVSVDMSEGSTASFMAGYADYSGSVWKMQTVRQQAAACEKATGANVVAAFNGDIFNMSTGEPTGALIMNNTVYKQGIGRPYFAILNDGTPVIGESLSAEMIPNIKEAISGFFILAKDGQRYGSGYTVTGLAPKTCVGIKADGTVIVYVADGRNYPTSCGFNNYDLASMMLGMGCVDVLNLDGGGSTTYAAQYEGSDSLVVANNPSDGVERKVSSALFITSSARPTGEFDHASLSPNNEIYTPNSTVQFSAIGVDSAGSSAELPADGQFVLAADSASMGTMTADGSFLSNGTTGTVNVQYISAGQDCGATSIEVQAPDEISFGDEEVSLGFSKESNLGLIVSYNGRTVNYKNGDFTWTMTDNSMGSFDGNTFISSDSNTVEGNITCSYVSNSAISGSIHAIIGRLPSVVQNFESNDIIFGRVAFDANGGIAKWETTDQTIINSCNMLTGHYLNGDKTSRGGKESAEIVDVDSGEPVRFGNQSLKLNYDFRGINGIEGACVGFTERSQEIEGNPTGIGMWVYAPEDCPNFWLRIRLLDGSDNILTLNFTEQKEGINWHGWKYVECSLEGRKGPFKLMGGETIRLMHTYSAYDGMGDWLSGTVTTAGPNASSVALNRSTCVGSIYVDNLQFVYGANVDDIDNPEVDTITANGEEITDGCVIDSNTVDFEAYFHDVENKYTSGIDYDVVRLYVDGVNRTYDSSYVLTQGDDRLDLYGLKLADGDHSVMVLLRDKFGNETTQTRNFTVDTDESGSASQLVNVALSTRGEYPVLNYDYDLYLESNSIDKISTVTTTIKVGSAFSDYQVDFNDAFDGTATYNAKTNEISLNANRVSQTGGSEDYIAKLTFKVPSDLASDAEFTYSVSNGQFTQTQPTDESIANSFALMTQRIPVKAPLTVSTDDMVVGIGGKVYVKDLAGDPVANINVYYSNGTLLGTTDEAGSFETSALTSSVAEFSIYAKNGDDISFIYSSQSLASAGNDDGTPTRVLLNASSNSQNSKNISWISSPIATSNNAVVQYALKADYEANGEASFTSVTGSSNIETLMGSADINNNFAIRLNSAEITDLAPASEYVYRVGDGDNWSDLSSFKTTYTGLSTNFFIIGDTQAEDTTNISNIINSLSTSGTDYSFGIQTGDFVEKPTMYADWDAILDVFGENYMTTVDMIHVIGNHEQFGDSSTNPFASRLFNAESPAYYSTEYGNVYVATISYTTNVQLLEEEMEWLVEDAAASNCQWKIVATHQPPYGTNAAATDTAVINEYLPSACQQAGIDFVFSGHDHAFARTLPMIDGAVDETNGIVYYICGSTGEKSYTATNNPDYNFDVVDQEYNAIYLTVEATDEYMRVVTHESDGRAIDTYTKTGDEVCKTNGHIYSYSSGYLTCDECGYSKLVGDYTGFATDAQTGRTMYFINGEKKLGWFTYINDSYYFDENGLAVTGTQKIGDIDGYEFDETGKQINGVFVTDESGTRCFRGGTYLRGWNEVDGELYYFSLSNGVMRTGAATVTVRTGQRLNYTFSTNGKLLIGAFYSNEDGTVYYWGGDMVTGWQEIQGKKYYFDTETNLMCTDEVELDGTVYAFNGDGQYVHDGAHSWDTIVTILKPSCTVDGKKIYICSECGTSKVVIEKATGHIDEDGDGKCDVCLKSMDHNSDFENYFYGLFNRIINRFWSIIEIIVNNFDVFKNIIIK